MTPTEFVRENSVVNSPLNYLLIALGAVAGASARYFLSTLIARNFSSAFPCGTLLINVTGSFAVGFFLAFSTGRALLDSRWRLLVVVGFCGSYTTFSAYASESLALMEQGRWLLSGANIVASNALCLAAVVGGVGLARAL
jgi:fluoride exporter